ncbi:MAG: TniQ family protein [Bacteroidetes bacterium]|nr:TniQ family protein [Bacteroidota bacterium]
MVSFFPIPFPDEIFYSVVSRYSLMTGVSSPKRINQQLFSDGKARQSIEFPNRLTQFHENTKELFPWSPIDVINKLSLMPFYENFIDERKKSLVISKMMGNCRANVRGTIGINRSHIKINLFPKYCIQCATEDLRNHGDIYWHRTHQLPIEVCPKHNIFLSSLNPAIEKFGTSFLYPAKDINKLDSSVRQNKNTLFKRIADLSLAILVGNSPLPFCSFNYRSELKNLGYLKGHALNIKALVAEVYSRYSQDEISEFLKSNVGTVDLRKYLLGPIHRPTKILNPIRHIFLRDLIESIKQNKISPSNPFGSGPWPCLNKAAEHFQKNVITQFSTRYETHLKQTVAIFKCDCGMIYKKYFRKYSHFNADTNCKETVKIISKGKTWQEKFNELIFQGKTSYFIAQELNTDIKSIRSLRKRLLNSQVQSQKKYEHLEEYRKIWLTLLSSKSDSNLTSLKKGKIFKWLYRHDKDWVISENKKYRTKNKRNKSLVIWPNVDQQLLQKLRLNHADFLQAGYKRRITKTLLHRSISNLKDISSEGHRHLLPLSTKFASEIAETQTSYQLRKIEMAVDELNSIGKRITRTSILVNTNFRVVTKEAEARIQELLSN